MSTTVTYKGSTLTTVENATKKLTTTGTWLEDDITIQDVSSGGGGNDLPVFTITYDSDDDYSVISATCNKTYSELYSMNQAGTLAGAIENAIIVGSDSYEYSTTLTFQVDLGIPTGGDDQLPEGDYLYFIRSGSQPLYDVFYSESNAVYVINPSRAAKTLTVTKNGNYTPEYGDYSWVEVNVSVPSSSPTLQDKTVSYTPSETAQSQMITADSGYDGLDEVSVSVGAISSTYVGTGIARKTSSDLTSSGATVTAPAGYYESAATKTVASGTAGTPTATKGSVSNHAVSVTPSVTNTAGYISGGTKTGTAVNVSASELVSGTYTVDSSGTKDVTNYASASVPSGTAGTPTASKGSVSNHAMTVTPSVTNTTGWITGSTKTGTGVSVSASELVSGSETKTANGTYDVTNLASLVVAVPIVTYYTGSSAPSSSLGSNGDIYLQTS